MALIMFISHSWFALNQQIIYLCKNSKANTHYIFYVPSHLAPKINNDYVSHINKNSAARITIIIYEDFHHGNYYKFSELKSTKSICLESYESVEVHFDLSSDPQIDNHGSIIIAYHYIKTALSTDININIHAWESSACSISERKHHPELLTSKLDEFSHAIKYEHFYSSFPAFTNKGYYILNHFYATTYHFVKPELSAKWFLDNLSIEEITLEHNFTTEQFKLYLALLNITPQDINKLKNIGDILFIKSPVLFYRYPFPQMADPGHEKNIDYCSIFSSILNSINTKSKITVIAGERDNQNNLNSFVNSFNGYNIDFCNLTIEALHHLKLLTKKPIKFISFLNPSAYLLSPHSLELIIVNENKESHTNNHELLSDFTCKKVYLNESEKMIPWASDFVICNTPDPLGDGLFALACIKSIKNRFAKKIAIIGRLFNDESLFLLNSDVDTFIDKNNIEFNDYALIYSGFERNKLLQVLPNAYNNNTPGHIIDNTLITLDIPFINTTASIDVNISDSNPYIDRLINEGKKAIIHPNQDAKNRSWPQEQWYSLVDILLQDGWTIFVIGDTKTSITNAKMSNIERPGVINLINKLKLSETLYLMSKCNLLISCDSGPVALAGATDIAIVGLYSIVEGERRIPYRHGVLGWNTLIVNLSCKYKNCFDTVRDRQLHSSIKDKIHDLKYISWPYSETCIAAATGGKAYQCLISYSAEKLYEEINNAIASELINISPVIE